MKRFLCLFMLVAVLLLGGCSKPVSDSKTLNVYTSFYPIYALTQSVTGDVPGIELHCLVQPQDGCLRNYTISDWDMALIESSADVVILGGRGLESFESTVYGIGENGPAVTSVLYNLELYNQDEASSEDENASHLVGANPHLYMSIDGAINIISHISASLCSLDAVYSEQYIANETQAANTLTELLNEMLETVGNTEGLSVIVMNEALVYVAQDYGLEIALCYDRESGVAYYDDELQTCIDALNEAGTDLILIEKQVPQAFEEALENAGFTVIKLDVLSTHTESDGFEGYCEAQRQNAIALREGIENSGGVNR